MGGRTAILWLALAVAGWSACGDPETSDVGRGYTKAPLENPGLLVGGEAVSAMAGVGAPDLLGSEDPAGLDREALGAEADEDEAEEREVTLAVGVTQEQFDEGRELFTGQGACQSCHGPNGGGTQLAPDLTDGEWLNVSGPNLEELAGVIRRGVPQPAEFAAPMPPMGGASLTDAQVQALAGYVASLAAD